MLPKVVRNELLMRFVVNVHQIDYCEAMELLKSHGYCLAMSLR